MRAQLSGANGFVVRGATASRSTRITTSNEVSQGSTSPLTGAALIGSGVAASGICPSAVSSPLVGSSPTQPAPGR